ncbi:MAG: Trm112 family protein [Nitrospiria bacterium]
MPVDPNLLEILACPQCKGTIQLNDKEDGLLCSACKLMYPIRNDIPVMLIDEAIRLDK